jgi:hypothetical protein
MKVLKLGFLLGTALGVSLLFSTAPSSASQKFAKETGKKCLD